MYCVNTVALTKISLKAKCYHLFSLTLVKEKKEINLDESHFHCTRLKELLVDNWIACRMDKLRMGFYFIYKFNSLRASVYA